MLLEVVCLIVTLYIFLRLWYENHTKPWKHFEQAPLPRYTLLGHIPSMSLMSDSEFFQRIHTWLENSKTDSILLWVGFRPWLITRNRILFEKILSSNKHIEKAKDYWIFKDWMENSNFLSTGDGWRKRRKLVLPSFHLNILNSFVGTMEKHSLELVNVLTMPAETGKAFDAFKVMKLYTIGIISETAMGVEANIVKTAFGENSKNITEKDRKFLDMVISTDRLVETLILRAKIPWYWYKPLFKLLPTGSQYYSDLKKIKSFGMNIIEKRIEELEKSEESVNLNSKTSSNVRFPNLSSEKSNDENTNSMNESSKPNNSQSHKKGTIFIDSMLSLYKNGDINVQDILNETQTFVFAGYDTIAAALSWSLYLLGRNKTQQDKAHEEAVRVKALGLPIMESIIQLKYIECVIKEVLRIHPSGGFIARYLAEDSQFGAEFYPRGTDVQFCIYEIQRDAKNYEEPMVFKPERFLQMEDSKKKDGRYTFVPFSAGPRICIGKKFAMLELKITLFHLLSEYEVIATQKEEDLKESFSVVHCVENENGLEIKLKKR